MDTSLPTEMLSMIVHAYVDFVTPFSLHLHRTRIIPKSNQPRARAVRYALNIMLVNKLFHHAFWDAMQKKFDGRLYLVDPLQPNSSERLYGVRSMSLRTRWINHIQELHCVYPRYSEFPIPDFTQIFPMLKKFCIWHRCCPGDFREWYLADIEHVFEGKWDNDFKATVHRGVLSQGQLDLQNYLERSVDVKVKACARVHHKVCFTYSMLEPPTTIMLRGEEFREVNHASMVLLSRQLNEDDWIDEHHYSRTI